MYIVDTDNNKLVKAEACTFKFLKLEERKHLQEWIAKEPSSLGEELLIIQKEFDGFSDTRERLDLLALDKQGNLVIIENKLDDSGRDVTWQAIKYASYCSSLSKEEIIRIYQQFLGSESAEESILEFLGLDDLEDAVINRGNSQRIFFVAANYRKEVTSSVLWLLDYGLDIKCFKVSPFVYNGKILVDFDQIIPIKDAEDYTIKMAKKKKVEAKETDATAARHNERKEFWNKFIEYNKTHSGPYAASAGTPDTWLGKSIPGIPGTSVNIVIKNEGSRTEAYINTGDKEHNKQIFDKLQSHRSDIESITGQLDWQRLDDKVTCRICISNDLSYKESDSFESICEFFTETTNLFLQAFGKQAKLFR